MTSKEALKECINHYRIDCHKYCGDSFLEKLKVIEKDLYKLEKENKKLKEENKKLKLNLEASAVIKNRFLEEIECLTKENNDENS